MSVKSTVVRTRSPVASNGAPYVRMPAQLMPIHGSSPITHESWPGGIS